MAVIDADAHVIENEHTWDFLEESELRFRPVTVTQTNPADARKEYWLVDGTLAGRRFNVGSDTPPESRELTNVNARLEHMDRLGVDLQVLFPSIFLQPLTIRPEVERAICRSYNRWLAEIWSQGRGRLRWAAVLPLMTISEALAELRFAHDNGACAVYVHSVEVDKRLDSPYFYPLYREASRLNTPIAVHASTGNQAHFDLYAGDSGFSTFKLPVIGAFHAIVYSDIPGLFPELRFGFIEVGAQWVPYATRDLARRFGRQKREMKADLFKTDRLYVACQSDDDVPYLVQCMGEDNLLIGSDYGHADTASELAALDNLRKVHGLEPRVSDKILDANARAFYGL